MPARKPKPLPEFDGTAEREAEGTGVEMTEVDGDTLTDRGPGPDQAETRASRWDTPRST